MASLAALRKKAKDLGIAATVIRSAEDADELQEIISDHTKSASKKSAKKKSGATSTKKNSSKKASVKKAKDDDDDEDEKPKRGRPKGSKNKNSKGSSGSKSKPAASKSATAGKAKRSTAAKGNSKKGAKKNSSTYEPKGGRNLLEDVDYRETDGWNPREDSAPDRIVKALRKFKGNRDKVFDLLVDDIWDFINKRTTAGDKRSKAEAEKQLRYRIARTDWDFAMRTGQHEKAENRVEYGTGGTGNGTFKPAKAAKSTKASSKKNSSAKSSKKTTTKATGKKRGRPAGSKNKAKSGSKR
jgi:hypothetical protein